MKSLFGFATAVTGYFSTTTASDERELDRIPEEELAEMALKEENVNKAYQYYDHLIERTKKDNVRQREYYLLKSHCLLDEVAENNSYVGDKEALLNQYREIITQIKPASDEKPQLAIAQLTQACNYYFETKKYCQLHSPFAFEMMRTQESADFYADNDPKKLYIPVNFRSVPKLFAELFTGLDAIEAAPENIKHYFKKPAKTESAIPVADSPPVSPPLTMDTKSVTKDNSEQTQYQIAKLAAQQKKEEKARKAVERAAKQKEEEARIAAELAAKHKEKEARKAAALRAAKQREEEKARKAAAERAAKQKEEEARIAAERAAKQKEEEARIAAERAAKQKEEEARIAAERAAKQKQEKARKAAAATPSPSSQSVSARVPSLQPSPAPSPSVVEDIPIRAENTLEHLSKAFQHFDTNRYQSGNISAFQNVSICYFSQSYMLNNAGPTAYVKNLGTYYAQLSRKQDMHDAAQLFFKAGNNHYLKGRAEDNHGEYYAAMDAYGAALNCMKGQTLSLKDHGKFIANIHTRRAKTALKLQLLHEAAQHYQHLANIYQQMSVTKPAPLSFTQLTQHSSSQNPMQRM